MKTKTKILYISIFSLLTVTVFWANIANIEKVSVLSQNSLNVAFTWKLDIVDGKVEGDMKVLKDISIQKTEKSPVADNVVSITLSEELTPNTSYSVLSVFWAEGNIDFAIGKKITWAEFINTDPENKNIDKLVVKDATEIDIYYKIALVWEDFEYKVLSWLWIDTLSKKGSDITVSVKNPISPDSNYIIMLLSLKDNLGKEISFDDGIFDFETQEINKEALQILSFSGAQLPQEWLNSAKEEKGNLKEVAMKTTEIPDTWAETWVLIIWTLIINSFIFSARRKKA